MKTRIITLLLIAIISLSFTSADAKGQKVQNKNNAMQTILSSIKYPEFAKDALIEGLVWVRLSIIDDGMVRVSIIQGSNEGLKKYVSKELAKIKLDVEEDEINKPMDMKFTFKLY